MHISSELQVGVVGWREGEGVERGTPGSCEDAVGGNVWAGSVGEFAGVGGEGRGGWREAGAADGVNQDE